MRTLTQRQHAPQKPVTIGLDRSRIAQQWPEHAGHPVQHPQGEAGAGVPASPRLRHDLSQIPLRAPAAPHARQVMRMAGPGARVGLGLTGRAEVPSSVHEVLRSAGQPLDGGTRNFMETRFAQDFSQVRVHTGQQAAESARALSAAAYTVGSDIAFDSGRYAPATQQGRFLLAHELAHVVQQSGQPAARLDKLSMTEPGDAAELEANAVAAAVTGGGNVPPLSASGTTVARQFDAGVADDGPHDAAPIAGGPEPAPVAPPALQDKAPVMAPSATIGKVALDVRADRIPPTKSVDVPVTLANIPAGASATVDVEGSGAGNGTAVITAGASLAATGKVTVKGDIQTAPGNAGKLRLRAKVGGTVVGRSSGFTVAAWPTDYTDPLNGDIDSGGAIGLSVRDGWSSDGSGPITELDKVKISERVDLQSRDNPPFKVVGAISAAPAGGVTSGYEAGDSLTIDSHTYGRADIDTTGLAAGPWTLVYGQLCIFKCARTGVTDLVMPKSGYTITHMAWKLPMVGWSHMARKVGTGVTVEGRTATAGAGDASSKLHKL